ncbi:gamma carbonic anhydrase family protein (plasmid) [Agrobacterium radiobacter]|uniref:Transferase n=1 Tax=Agrobacterium tumefaciens str. B6 TaxID=1183423 RepID=A0A822VBW8_AGRTU|nr:gamma carbonic anhydrase family protein [Agrobacterium tumefaciens]KWT83965.1 transferase [Agrobacterium tumefaciens str. B6]MQB28839.1 gamma carbonic anhydrase family protein [Agrobacterium tumefaciens]NTA05135.1 gamma carbonic anhydrase family protein [Agrobacterium tumefaciens]NTA91730.1 gamma carbonic anhydrase family protein [Agrobacterium tumefaciens]NTB12880.1 gamma carbonic anhydrase family protein [Agrobacterium tumefaciens]
MILSYEERSPSIDPTAWVAEDATVCGDVTIGAGSRIMHGARLVAEAGGSIRIGRNCIVFENGVIRATSRHDCSVGDHCIVGPNSHVVGGRIDAEVFVATGAAVFHGAQIGHGSEVRINGTVHLRTRLEPGSTIPIGWVAVGDPAQILSPDQHEAIWEIQKTLDFPGFVYGVDRTAPDVMKTITSRLSEVLGRHRSESGC